MNTVFRVARQLDVRVMVDAEQTYFQPAIARLTMEMMKKYNTEKAIVFNTYQVRRASTNNFDWCCLSNSNPCLVLSQGRLPEPNRGHRAGQQGELLLRGQAGARGLYGAGRESAAAAQARLTSPPQAASSY